MKFIKKVNTREVRSNSIAESIRLIINSRPFIKEAITKGIVNYSALADFIKKDIEKLTNLNRPISKESIVAATIRYSKGLKTEDVSEDILRTIANLNFLVKTNIRLLSLSKKNVKKEDFLKIFKRFELESEEQLIVFQGIKDIILVSDGPNYAFLSEYFGDRLELLQENLALFIIHSEGIPQYIPGYLEFFTSKLAENGINIEVYSSKEDLILLVEEKDVARTYSLLNNAKFEAQQMMMIKD